MSELVRRTDTDGVAVVELNRPDRKNAMTGPLMAALANTMEAIAADENVDAVVLCGAVRPARNQTPVGWSPGPPCWQPAARCCCSAAPAPSLGEG